MNFHLNTRRRGTPIFVAEMPKYIIVDLRNFIEFQTLRPLMMGIDQIFPVRSIISTILAFNQYIGYSDAFWFELERRNKDLDKVNTNVLEIYLEGFVHELDEFIRSKVPKTTDTGQYVIDRWLDSTTIVLKHDELSGMFCDTGPFNHGTSETIDHRGDPRVLRPFNR